MKPRDGGNSAILPNQHTFREQWLSAGLDSLRPWFNDRGFILPEKVRIAIGFTGQGRNGSLRGQLWHAEASEGGFYEIFIRPDLADPVDVLTVLIAQLVSTQVPAEAGHGPAYKKVAVAVGLEGPMRNPKAGVSLRERLNALSGALGPLPHQSIDTEWRAINAPAKQGTRLLLAVCPGCEFPVRFARRWFTNAGPPICAKCKTAFQLQTPETSEPSSPSEQERRKGVEPTLSGVLDDADVPGNDDYKVGIKSDLPRVDEVVLSSKATAQQCSDENGRWKAAFPVRPPQVVLDALKAAGGRYEGAPVTAWIGPIKGNLNAIRDATTTAGGVFELIA